jgi:hypothetical protein
MFALSLLASVVMPTSLPDASNNPPPLDPGETGAVVCINCSSLAPLSAETSPSLKVRSSPRGLPSAYTLCPIRTCLMLPISAAGSCSSFDSSWHRSRSGSG